MENRPEKEKAQLLEYMTGIRRDLHSMPELSSREFETSAYIKSRLGEIGLSASAAHTGLIADITGTEGKRTVALRADFDGLPIKERTGLPFASTNGCMHACGHDGHTAMLLGAAKYLTEHKPLNNVRLVFQFGEEGDGGAATMIEHGALAGVDEIFALHLCPELGKGLVGTNEATLFAGVTEFDVTFKGKSSHCASKNEGVDALAAAVDFASGIDACRGNKAGTLVHVGKITAGSARNVVADYAKLECTFRFFSEDDRDGVIENMRALAEAIDEKKGTDGKLTIKSVYPPLVNSPQSVKTLRSVTETVETPGRYTAEDFAFYLKEAPGCMAWLGVRDEEHCSPLHSDDFDFDESVLLNGAGIFIKLADTTGVI